MTAGSNTEVPQSIGRGAFASEADVVKIRFNSAFTGHQLIVYYFLVFYLGMGGNGVQ